MTLDESSKHSSPVPVSPDLETEMIEERQADSPGILDFRTIVIGALASVVACLAVGCAKLLVLLIALVTNLAFFTRLSVEPANPALNRLGPFVIVVPVLGGLLVGVMARYGSRAIRGHGIPEAMEQVLTNGSRIAPRITLLKPTSSAIAIGTGGPFGAEGPIIATGGALGSLIGQVFRTTAIERKTLLAAGAAAGMTAIFNTPIAAVVLAIELLLFEMRPQTLVPVAIACAVADGLRGLVLPDGPAFAMPAVAAPTTESIVFYVLLGLAIGLAATCVTRIVYAIEDAFERLPVHWMWWPAIGGLAVGLVGFFFPRTLGVGYGNITDIVSGRLAGGVLLTLCVAKFVSWSISLGSGTSGGTLAPLLTIGGGLGAFLGSFVAGVDPRVAGLVGMAAMFAGASRALLTSIVFAFEATRQPTALLPLLGGCAAAYLVSCLLMRNTIMTEKIARRGIRVPNEYVADYLDHVAVSAVGLKNVVSLDADMTLARVREWIKSHRRESEHQGFPVLDRDRRLIGVVTRRNLLDPARSEDVQVRQLVERKPVTVSPDATLRDAADRMVRTGVGRLPIVDDGGNLVGIVTRSDLLAAHQPRIREHEERERTIHLASLAVFRGPSAVRAQRVLTRRRRRGRR